MAGMVSGYVAQDDVKASSLEREEPCWTNFPGQRVFPFQISIPSAEEGHILASDII